MRICFRMWMLFMATMTVLLIPLFGDSDEAKGKETFSRCAVCHGDSGQGKEAIAKLYDVKMKALSSKEVQSMDDDAIKKVITEGKGKMKPLVLSDQEIENVILFLRSLKE